MSKIPNHTIWARAATTSAAASSSTSRATSIFAKTHHHGPSTIGTSSLSQRKSVRPSNVNATATQQSVHWQAPDASTLAAMGAVSAPYYGPQPAAVVDVYEQQQQLALTWQPHNGQESARSSAHVPFYSSSSLALSNPVSFSSLASFSQSLLSNHVLRSMAAISPSLQAPQPQRPMHQWTSAHNPSATEVTVSSRALKHRQKSSRLLFDVTETTSRSSTKAQRGVEASEQAEELHSAENIDELFASLWLTRSQMENGDMQRGGSSGTRSAQAVKQRPTYRSSHTQSALFTPSNPFLSNDANAYLDNASASASSTSADASPSASPSPSPGPSEGFRSRDVGHRSPFGNVREPPSKFAVTTSAQGHVTSSSTTEGNVSTPLSSSQNHASLSAASSVAGSSGALPPQASSPAGTTDHWARTFNIPRSTKRHDFMFEHGAYGIPKRHPLSSIRSSPPAPDSTSERSTPSRDDVPSGKVRAATDMLSAAAEFFGGSQRVGMAKDGFTPFKGRDALQAALAGGSTAQEYELRPQEKSTGKDGRESRSTGVHQMAIRGPDGRIIKERLRSVQVGEDAYFLRPDALGVADGVGGWASRPGADPALFSRLLMHFCAVELSRYDGLTASQLAADNGTLLKAWASVDPVEVMHRAWQRCVRASRREGILGSSTALIGLLRGDELRIANMGDCVLMIIRGGEMMFRSTEQQHSFNFPVQLGMMGDTTDTIKKHVMASQVQRERAAGEGEIASGPMEDYDAVEDGTENATTNVDEATAASQLMPERDGNEEFEPEWDEPRRDAGHWAIRVEAGDIIVVGSDGLMDNLFDEDIIEEVLRFLPNGQGDQQEKLHASNFSPQLVSEALCSRAKAVSEDSRAISSPFQQRAMEEGLNYVGGKHDDISVLVCVVGERDGLELDTDDSESGDASATSSDDERPKTPKGAKTKTEKYLF